MKKLILLLMVCISLVGNELDRLQKDCDDGNGSVCFILGIAYAEQDNFKAAELFKKACDGGEAPGCFNFGVAYDKGEGVKQDSKKALELFGRACDMKLQSGCHSYAKLKKNA